jgi:hypothetical protein
MFQNGTYYRHTPYIVHRHSTHIDRGGRGSNVHWDTSRHGTHGHMTLGVVFYVFYVFYVSMCSMNINDHDICNTTYDLVSNLF